MQKANLQCECNQGIAYRMVDGNHIVCERCSQGQRLVRSAQCSHSRFRLKNPRNDTLIGCCLNCDHEFEMPKSANPVFGKHEIRLSTDSRYMLVTRERFVYLEGEQQVYDLKSLYNTVLIDGFYYAPVETTTCTLTIRAQGPLDHIDYIDPQPRPPCPQCSAKDYYLDWNRDSKICARCYVVYPR